MPQIKKKHPLLRSKDVAHILDIPPDDVNELARRNKIKATKAGRLWRFRLADVMAYKKRIQKEGE